MNFSELREKYKDLQEEYKLMEDEAKTLKIQLTLEQVLREFDTKTIDELTKCNKKLEEMLRIATEDHEPGRWLNLIDRD